MNNEYWKIKNKCVGEERGGGGRRPQKSGTAAAGTIFIFSGWRGPEITYVIFQRYSRSTGEQTMGGKLAVIASDTSTSPARPLSSNLAELCL